MVEINIDSWADFSSEVKRLRDKHSTIVHQLSGGREYPRPNLVLFRGQSNDKWALETTLERRTKHPMHVGRYILAVNRCVNELESFTGKRWGLKTYPELIEEIEQRQEDYHAHLPCYEYLVYLRHHGFSSPLLDWTTSPFIAAYFAFCDAADAERVAVYVYVSTTTGAKGERIGDPRITLRGPFTTTHPRHFAQKAWYTTATEWSQTKQKHFFCSHSNIFSRNDTVQDVLIKLTLPRSERRSALRDLDDHNINHFTLFQSEDALVRAMAMKQFDLDEWESV